ncbi:MAG: hypothetical protein U5L96_15585 [Owenweeksia sp.]|nr:hypothetical protein [Owenweeksia sp.]
MKRFVSILGIFCITVITAQAQSPGQFDYQAVLRDGSGNLMKNQTVDLRIGIYDGSSMEYEETHNVTTDQFGLVSLAIGQGTVSSGTFSSLDWANSQYEIKVEVDDGSGYVSLGQKALSSVPYALHAESAPAPSLAMDNLTDVNAGSPSSNEVLKWDGSNWVPQADNAGGSSIWSTTSGDVYYNSGNVGIGNASPSSALHLTLGGTAISDGFKMTGSGNEDWYFYLPTSNSLTLRDDGSDIITFENNTGNVGIGTSTPFSCWM